MSSSQEWKNQAGALRQTADDFRGLERRFNDTASAVQSTLGAVEDSRIFLRSMGNSAHVIMLLETSNRVYDIGQSRVDICRDSVNTISDCIRRLDSYLAVVDGDIQRLVNAKRTRDDAREKYKKWAVTDNVWGLSQFERAVRDEGDLHKNVKSAERQFDELQTSWESKYQTILRVIERTLTLLQQRHIAADGRISLPPRPVNVMNMSLSADVLETGIAGDLEITELSDGTFEMTLCGEASAGWSLSTETPHVEVESNDQRSAEGVTAGVEASVGVNGCVTFALATREEVQLVLTKILLEAIDMAAGPVDEIAGRLLDLINKATFGLGGKVFDSILDLAGTLGIPAENALDFLKRAKELDLSDRLLGGEVGINVSASAYAKADVGIIDGQPVPTGIAEAGHDLSFAIEGGIESSRGLEYYRGQFSINSSTSLNFSANIDILREVFPTVSEDAKAELSVKRIFTNDASPFEVVITMRTEHNGLVTEKTWRIKDPSLVEQAMAVGGVATSVADIGLWATVREIDHDTSRVSFDTREYVETNSGGFNVAGLIEGETTEYDER